MKFVKNLRAGGWGGIAGSNPAIIMNESADGILVLNLTGIPTRELRPASFLMPLTGIELEAARKLAQTKLDMLDTCTPNYAEREALRAALNEDISE